VLVLTAPAQSALFARLKDKRHAFFPAPNQPQGHFAVMVPVPLDTPIGVQSIAVEYEGGTPVNVPFTVMPSTASSVEVKVAPSKTQLSAEDKARVAREAEVFKAILASPGTARLWQGPFHKPGGGIVTCGFGTTRRFNGAAQSIHKGLDLRAATGTPVPASGPGTVRLAKNVFFGGNLVFLDHGFGLFTAYAHMSRLDVSPGQVVQTGQLMGLSGATGRVSAPHLHWGTSIDGVDVDPILMQKAMAALCKIGVLNTTPGRRHTTTKASRPR
jgi:murein DD-endopeptidase MepM/ murein hydrolase activator NlpD